MIEFLVISLSLYATLTAFLAMNGFLEDDSYIIALVLIAAYLLLRDRVPSRFLEITYGIIIVLFSIMAMFSNTYLWRLQ